MKRKMLKEQRQFVLKAVLTIIMIGIIIAEFYLAKTEINAWLVFVPEAIAVTWLLYSYKPDDWPEW